MLKGPGKIVRDKKSSSYPVFELTGVNCISFKSPIDILVHGRVMSFQEEKLTEF